MSQTEFVCVRAHARAIIHMCIEAMEGVESLTAVIRGTCELWFTGAGIQTPILMTEQQIFLTTEASLQLPLGALYKKLITYHDFSPF